MKEGVLTTAAAGPGAAGTGAAVPDAGSANVLVTVKITLLDVWSGESNVAALPDGAHVALAPSSSQAYATVVAPPVAVSVIVHVVNAGIGAGVENDAPLAMENDPVAPLVQV